MSQASTQTPERPGTRRLPSSAPTAFTAAGQLHYLLDATGNTIIEGNTTGAAGAEFQIQVAGVHTFVASDFVL